MISFQMTQKVANRMTIKKLSCDVELVIAAYPFDVSWKYYEFHQQMQPIWACPRLKITCLSRSFK